jgi:hypothetical protein
MEKVIKNREILGQRERCKERLVEALQNQTELKTAIRLPELPLEHLDAAKSPTTPQSQ